MIERAVLLSDDTGPHESDVALLVMHADWSRPRGTLFRLDVVSCYLQRDLRPDELAVFVASSYPGDGLRWEAREGALFADTSATSFTTRLRTHGGHFPPFALHWHKIVDAAQASGFALPDNLCRFRGNDWFVGPDDADGTRHPFTFTAADATAHPRLPDRLREGFAIARAMEPFSAKKLEAFHPAVPFRAALQRRHPGRMQAPRPGGL